MRFLVDECTGPAVARWLREHEHDVFSVYEEARGMDDSVIVQKAFAENRIFITDDKDFGERVYREHQPHRGVVLLRLEDERAAVKIDVLRQLLASYADRLADQYVVVTETWVRFAGSNVIPQSPCFPRSFQVQRQQSRQDLVVGQVSGPAVRGEHGRVQRPVRQVEPRRPRIVEVGEGALGRDFKVSETSKVWVGLSHASRFATRSAAAAAMARTRGSSAGSRPGGQGKGKVSKVVVGV